MTNKQRDLKREDYMTNRILAVFTYAFVLVMGLMLVYRGFTNIETYLVTYSAMWIVLYVSLGLTVLLAALAVWSYRKKQSEPRVFSFKNCAVGMAVLAVCAFFAANYMANGVKLMYIFVPAVSALLLFYFLYPNDFFSIAAVLACAAGVLLYFSAATGAGYVWERGIKMGKPLYFAVAAVLLLVAYVIANATVAKNRGVLKLGKQTYTIYPKTARYKLAYVSAAVSFAAVLVGYLCGGTVAYYLAFAVLGYLFILAVYYTVKLL